MRVCANTVQYLKKRFLHSGVLRQKKSRPRHQGKRVKHPVPRSLARRRHREMPRQTTNMASSPPKRDVKAERHRYFDIL